MSDLVVKRVTWQIIKKKLISDTRSLSTSNRFITHYRTEGYSYPFCETGKRSNTGINYQVSVSALVYSRLHIFFFTTIVSYLEISLLKKKGDCNLKMLNCARLLALEAIHWRSEDGPSTAETQSPRSHTPYTHTL